MTRCSSACCRGKLRVGRCGFAAAQAPLRGGAAQEGVSSKAAIANAVGLAVLFLFIFGLPGLFGGL